MCSILRSCVDAGLLMLEEECHKTVIIHSLCTNTSYFYQIMGAHKAMHDAPHNGKCDMNTMERRSQQASKQTDNSTCSQLITPAS